MNEDLQNQNNMWSFYDEFQNDLKSIAKEEWILLRGKTYKVDEFLSTWEKKIEEKPTSFVLVKMMQEISHLKVIKYGDKGAPFWL